MDIRGLHLLQGGFCAPDEESRASAICVLGAGAKSNLFGTDDPLRRWVKLNQQWFQVIGVASPQLSSQTEVVGVPAQDFNNLIYVPLNAAIFRLEDSYSAARDEIDGISLHLRDQSNVPQVAQVLRPILASTHHAARRFTL